MKRFGKVVAILILVGIVSFWLEPVFPTGRSFTSSSIRSNSYAVATPSYHYFGCGAVCDKLIVISEGGNNFTNGPIWAEWHCIRFASSILWNHELDPR